VKGQNRRYRPHVPSNDALSQKSEDVSDHIRTKMLSRFFHSSCSRIKTVNRRYVVVVGGSSPVPMRLSRQERKAEIETTVKNLVRIYSTFDLISTWPWPRPS